MAATTPRAPATRERARHIVVRMRTYKLYLESGPQKKTTLVHVIDLLGCTANAKTTDEALAGTPDAIRAYLAYLKRHGADVEPNEPFATRVAEHITKGDFLGQGSPHAVYAPDLRPLAAKDLKRVLPWLEWSRADLLALVKGIDDRRLRAKPERGRSLYEILRHVGEAEPHYITGVLGRVEELTAAGNAIYHDRIDIRDGLRAERAALIERLRALTAEERRLVKRAPGRVRTIRRGIRRTLEHEWEHRREIATRLGTAA